MFQERERDHICGCARCTSRVKDYKYRATLKKEAADYSEMLVNTKLSLDNINYLISVILILTEPTTSISTQKGGGGNFLVQQRRKCPALLRITSKDLAHFRKVSISRSYAFYNLPARNTSSCVRFNFTETCTHQPRPS